MAQHGHSIVLIVLAFLMLIVSVDFVLTIFLTLPLSKKQYNLVEAEEMVEAEVVDDQVVVLMMIFLPVHSPSFSVAMANIRYVLVLSVIQPSLAKAVLS